MFCWIAVNPKKISYNNNTERRRYQQRKKRREEKRKREKKRSDCKSWSYVFNVRNHWVRVPIINFIFYLYQRLSLSLSLSPAFIRIDQFAVQFIIDPNLQTASYLHSRYIRIQKCYIVQSLQAVQIHSHSHSP